MMNDINNIRNSLGKLENAVKSSAPNASNSLSSEASNGGGSTTNQITTSRADAITTDFKRQFPQFGGGHRINIPTKKRVFVPKTTFTTNFCCIAKRRSEATPSTSEMLYLNSAGLGKRRVVFDKKDGDHFYLIRVLEQQFPQLIPLDGGFLLLRATSGGGGCRPLIQIPMDTDGYSLTWLRNSCNINSSSTVYIVPVQQDIEGKVLDNEVDTSIMPSTKCMQCAKPIAITKLAAHSLICLKNDVREVKRDKVYYENELPQSDKDFTIVPERTVKKYPLRESKVCKDCGCTIFGNICLRCEQNAACKSSLKRDSGLGFEKDLTRTEKPYSSCTITSPNHNESLNVRESIKKDSGESSEAETNENISSETDTNENISSSEIRSRRIAKFSTFTGRIDPEGKESDISYGDEEVSSFFERESEKRHDTAVVDGDIHSPGFVDLAAEKIFLQDIVLKQENEERSSKMLILHRYKFWPVFFRNKVDFVKDKVTVKFAGEEAIDNGGPFREFLRLAMKYFSNLPMNMLFGNAQKKLMSTSAQALERKYYYVLGQLSAVSIAFVGRGPECLHEELVNCMFGSPLSVDFTLDDAQFKSNLADIEKGIFDCLYEASISPSDDKRKELYINYFAIYKHSAAIVQFMNGITSISRELLATTSMKRYFVVRNVTLSASDILKLLDYQYEHEPGSNGRLAEDDAVIELEFLISDLADGKVENATIQDLLIFITTCDVIPPCGFGQKLSIFFTEKSCLATSPTCGLSMTVPLDKTRERQS